MGSFGTAIRFRIAARMKLQSHSALLFTSLLVAALVSGCTGLLRPHGKRAELKLDESTRLLRFFEELEATDLDRSPMHATLAGLRQQIPAWDDLSEAHLDRTKAWLETAARRLQQEFPARTAPLEAGPAHRSQRLARRGIGTQRMAPP